ncbi:MAG: hypothetical protein AAGF12_34505 [Myxococcota bacterium]
MNHYSALLAISLSGGCALGIENEASHRSTHEDALALGEVECELAVTEADVIPMPPHFYDRVRFRMDVCMSTRESDMITLAPGETHEGGVSYHSLLQREPSGECAQFQYELNVDGVEGRATIYRIPLTEGKRLEVEVLEGGDRVELDFLRRKPYRPWRVAIFNHWFPQDDYHYFFSSLRDGAKVDFWDPEDNDELIHWTDGEAFAVVRVRPKVLCAATTELAYTIVAATE